MPTTSSAKKALRQSLRHRAQNLRRKKAFKQTTKSALAAGKEDRDAAIAAAYKAIDKAAKRGTIKKRAAARKKSRLVKTINRQASSS